MQKIQPSLIARPHTLLGICEAIGEDFGFNPVYLRIILAVSLLWKPPVTVGVYVGLGVLVLLTRLLVPDPRRVAAPAIEPQARAEAAGAAANGEQLPLPMAA